AGYSYSHRIASSNWIAAVGSRNSYGAGSQDNLADFLASKFLYGACFLQPIPDVARTRFLLVVATNPAISQGTLVHMADAKSQLRAVRERGGKVVVIDPRRSETARLASEHHFIRPDTDVFLLLAMTHVILSEGLVDLVDVVARLGLDGYGKHRSRVGNLPGVLGELPSGVLADEITTPGPGQVRALVVTAGNPVLSTANGPALAAAMRQLE